MTANDYSVTITPIIICRNARLSIGVFPLVGKFLLSYLHPWWYKLSSIFNGEFSPFLRPKSLTFNLNCFVNEDKQ